jgi:small-conductance mechanosensitive channel
VEDIMEITEYILYHNSLRAWAIALVVFFVILAVLTLVQRLALKQVGFFARLPDGKKDGLVTHMLVVTKGFTLIVVAANLASRTLSLPLEAHTFIRIVTITALLVQAGFWGNALILHWLNRRVKRQMEMDAERATTLDVFGLIARIILWVVVALLVLDNLPNVQVNTLIASLGITGIAVALAVQNILGDLFASFSIVMDKPFVIGDYIIVDEYRGTVEHIGLKSTRIRSLTGEQLIFSNSDLLSSRVRNYKRMARRRILFNLGVTYQTSYEKIAAIPGMIREIIERQPEATVDRAHFHEYGDHSLNIEVVYWVENPEYLVYMDIQQAINLEIYRCFAENGIEFAYPTQTIFMQPENATEPD